MNFGPPESFAHLASGQKIEKKYAHFLQPVKVWLVTSQERNFTAIDVLRWERVTLDEMAAKSVPPPVQ